MTLVASVAHWLTVLHWLIIGHWSIRKVIWVQTADCSSSHKTIFRVNFSFQSAPECMIFSTKFPKFSGGTVMTRRGRQKMLCLAAAQTLDARKCYGPTLVTSKCYGPLELHLRHVSVSSPNGWTSLGTGRQFWQQIDCHKLFVKLPTLVRIPKQLQRE